MTPEQQRIAIAKACGWKPDPEWFKKASPPDYLNDLNSIREAEEHIPPECYQEYFNRLVYSEYPVPLDQLELTRRAVFASASQKAEAFLRALNLWQE